MSHRIREAWNERIDEQILAKIHRIDASSTAIIWEG